MPDDKRKLPRGSGPGTDDSLTISASPNGRDIPLYRDGRRRAATSAMKALLGVEDKTDAMASRFRGGLARLKGR